MSLYYFLKTVNSYSLNKTVIICLKLKLITSFKLIVSFKKKTCLEDTKISSKDLAEGSQI